MGIIPGLQIKILRLGVLEAVSYTSQKGEADLKFKSPDSMWIFFLLGEGKCLPVISGRTFCVPPHPQAAGTVLG